MLNGFRAFYGFQKSQIVQDGLTIYLDPSNTESYPGSGSIIYNLAGSPNGTFVNNTSYSTFSDGSIYFDGDADYVSLGNLGSMYQSGTISFWMYSGSVSNYRNPFTTKLDGSNVGIRFEQTSGGIMGVVVGDDSGNYGGTGYVVIPDLVQDEWRNVCFTWNTVANNMKAYVDGIQTLDQSHSFWATTMSNVVFGRGFSTDPVRHFLGYFGNFLMYNKELSQEEVSINFDVTKKRFVV